MYIIGKDRVWRESIVNRLVMKDYIRELSQCGVMSYAYAHCNYHIFFLGFIVTILSFRKAVKGCETHQHKLNHVTNSYVEDGDPWPQNIIWVSECVVHSYPSCLSLLWSRNGQKLIFKKWIRKDREREREGKRGAVGGEEGEKKLSWAC